MPSGNKPLPGPMLTQIYIAIWRLGHNELKQLKMSPAECQPFCSGLNATNDYGNFTFFQNLSFLPGMSSAMGYVTLVAIAGTTILVPSHVVQVSTTHLNFGHP